MAHDDSSHDTIFCGAIEIASSEERDAFIARACGSDAELRRRVERLVGAHFQAGSFLESPPESATLSAGTASSTDGPGAVIGPYKLLQPIGEGGMGTVYMAEQTHPVRRTVALKLIKAGMDSRQVLARFGAERQALALMDHPNIAKVFDAGTTAAGRPYFVMELVKGVPITKFCDERRLTLRERLELAFLEVLRVIREDESPRPSMRLSTTEELPSIAACRNIEPRKLSGVVRGELDWIVMKALEKDRNRRYETANGLAADLRRYLDDEPVEAYPPTAAYRLSKFAKRYRVPLATACAFAAVLLTATIISLWQAVRANRARAEAFLAYAGENKQRREAQDQRDRALKAESEAEANLAQAQSEEAKAQAVLEFFQEKVVAAARPEGEEGGLGHSVTLRAAIDAAESSITTSFAGKPTVEASIRNALGQSYRALGVAAQALPQYERARELQTRALGPDHPDTLTSIANTALAYWELGRTSESIVLQEAVLKRFKSKLGPDDRRTLVTMNNLALAYRDFGRMSEAITLHEEAVKLMKAKLGLDDPETLRSMGNLALEYSIAGRTADAVPLHEETHRHRKAKLGDDHPDTLGGMNYLAAAYRSAGRRTEAIAILEEAVKLQKAKLGPGHPETLIGMNGLAFAYQDIGRNDDGMRLLEESVQLFKSKLGLDYPGTGITMYYLAAAYLKAERWGQAETVLRECLAQREKKQPDDWMRFLMMSRLGTALSGQNRYAEAEPLLIKGYEGALAREIRIPAQMKNSLPNAVERIVSFYDAWGKQGKAAEWRTKLKPAAAKPKQE